MKRLTGWQLVALSLAMALVMASTAFAQGQGGGGGRRGGGRGGFGRGGFGGGFDASMLVGMDQVAKELELADEQKAEIKKIADEAMAAAQERFAGLRDLSEDERRAKFEEMRKEGETARAEIKKKIDEILLPEQRERLDQIALQVQGSAALSTEAVATKLGLTAEQKTKIEEVQNASREKMQAAFGDRRRGQDGGGQGQGGGREEMAKLRAETQEQVMAVLTDEQKQKLSEMKGKTFELDMSQFRRGGGGGGRGGDRGQRGNRQQRPASEA